ncbi:MAG: hypothetical protein GC157_05380 [Frankiales bacterium]|nr:hypothetical protein [Frankiales bacterium]
MLITALSAKALAGVVGASTIVLGGGAAAAYAGVLPSPIQSVAHTLAGAPAPAADEGGDQGDQGDDATTDPSTSGDPTSGDPTSADPSGSTSSSDTTGASGDQSDAPDPTMTGSAGPVGPDATGPAAFGLCNAYLHGGLAPQSIAYRNLAAAASAAPGTVTGTIEEYCATVPHHGRPSSTPDPSVSTDPSAATTTTEPTRHGHPSHSRPSHAGHKSHPAHPAHP